MQEIRSAGGEVALIGNGTPSMAKGFSQLVGLGSELPVLTDSSGKAHRLAGMRRSILLTLGPLAWLNFARTLLRGFRQGGIQGDPYQQGGALVVRPDGSVAYRFRSLAPGNHAPVSEILRALKRVDSR